MIPNLASYSPLHSQGMMVGGRVWYPWIDFIRIFLYFTRYDVYSTRYLSIPILSVRPLYVWNWHIIFITSYFFSSHFYFYFEHSFLVLYAFILHLQFQPNLGLITFCQSDFCLCWGNFCLFYIKCSLSFLD